MKITRVNSFTDSDFSKLVQETYNRPYEYQQQDGCKQRGVESFKVPNNDPCDYSNSTVEERVNGNVYGVSFKAWLERDPDQKLNDAEDPWDREHGNLLFWYRNFYPHIDMLLNDLYDKGKIPEGEYQLVIDW